MAILNNLRIIFARKFLDRDISQKCLRFDSVIYLKTYYKRYFVC